MQEINYYKQMRILLLYDMPMVDREDQQIYNKFHNNLKKIGYYMLQYSVYTKVIQNDTSLVQNKERLKQIIPKTGNIVIIKITEKQYQNMVHLSGEKNLFDVIVGGNELVIFKNNNDQSESK